MCSVCVKLLSAPVITSQALFILKALFFTVTLSFHLFYFCFLTFIFSPSIPPWPVILSLPSRSCVLFRPLTPSFPRLTFPPPVLYSWHFSKPPSYGRRVQRSREDVRALHHHRRAQELGRQRGHVEDVPALQRFSQLPHAHHRAGERTKDECFNFKV